MSPASRIDDLLVEVGADGEIDLLSIDIDGNDLWVWEAVARTSARVVVVEYNASFGPDRSVSVPYDPDFDRMARHPSGYYHGASVTALARLGARKGYVLAGCDSNGVNAFFVRGDCAPEIVPPADPAEAWRPLRERGPSEARRAVLGDRPPATRGRDLIDARDRRRVHVYVPTLAPSDAVSDQARPQAALLTSWGHEAVVVADGWHPDCEDEVIALDQACRRPRGRVGGALQHLGRRDRRHRRGGGRAQDPGVPQRHAPGLVPPGPVADRCAQALRELPGLAGAWDLVIADSAFNAADLRAAGFGAVEVVPLLLPHAPPPPPSERGDSVLFVGRVSPSKGVDDLVKAFALLRTLHRPEADPRPGGLARWMGALRRWTSRSWWRGSAAVGSPSTAPLSDAERDDLYARAGVVCLLSRHEGFCAPMVEAMRAGAPSWHATSAP